jgi:hypothetical protein
MAYDAQSLLSAAKCYTCGDSDSPELMKVALLAQLLKGQNPVADTTAQTLMNQAKCYACVPANQRPLLELALLAQLVLVKNPAADVTPTNLMKQAKCYNCGPNEHDILLMQLSAIAQQIV